ncbi:MAG: sigma 54-interacting transcriptional regulator [Parvularculaceae bacterium]|nr:sigma 54-interacting transcriptional regulator [Parvularculaceae bacterium]
MEESELIGRSPAFLEALAHASSLAPLDRPVLICGERGSGKELIAARIHYLSRRWEAPFLKVNCAALAEDLLESDLFGHEAGAFTGAQKRRLGRFERADGGTLFLDEIASASLRVQEKLLRIIEYGEFERVGGEAALSTDVRIIAAANVDLEQMAAEGRFRWDLLDRLAFDVVAAPPIRVRGDDIPLLAAHFAGALARDLGARFEGFTEDALAALAAHAWPGNVRELKNVAERSLHRWVSRGAGGPVAEVHIDAFAAARRPERAPAAAEPAENAQPPHDLRAALDALERRWTTEALALCAGSQKRAAERLGLTYDQLRGVMRKHGVAVSGVVEAGDRKRRTRTNGPT